LKVLDCDAIGWTKIDPVRVELDDLSALKHEPISHGGKNFAADSGNAFRGLEVGEMAERECQIAAQAVDQNLEGALKSGESAAFERVGCQFGAFLCVETIGAQIGDHAWHAVECQDCRGIQAGNVAMPYVLDHASDEKLTAGRLAVLHAVFYALHHLVFAWRIPLEVGHDSARSGRDRRQFRGSGVSRQVVASANCRRPLCRY